MLVLEALVHIAPEIVELLHAFGVPADLVDVLPRE
jgi:hypothetical protein